MHEERRTGSSDEDTKGLRLRSVRTPREWRVCDRLAPEDITHLIERYHAGATAKELAAQYSIGLTDVKRLLREHQARRKDRRDTAV